MEQSGASHNRRRLLRRCHDDTTQSSLRGELPMRIIIRRRPPAGGRGPATHLIEIVTPRTNAATITPLENLLAGLAPTGRFALEIVATAERHRFLARASCADDAEQLIDQLGAAYPQADLRPFPLGEEEHTTDTGGAEPDPAARAPGERVLA